MKLSDYISVIMIAILGTIVGYFLLNSLLGDPTEKTVLLEYLEGAGSDLVNPDSEVFNYQAINPTVEVYIGNCEDLDRDGSLSEDELRNCGQSSQTINSGETLSPSDSENARINLENGYSSVTPREQRESVEAEIEQNRQSVTEQNTETQTIDLNDPDRRETVSGS